MDLGHLSTTPWGYPKRTFPGYPPHPKPIDQYLCAMTCSTMQREKDKDVRRNCSRWTRSSCDGRIAAPMLSTHTRDHVSDMTLGSILDGRGLSPRDHGKRDRTGSRTLVPQARATTVAAITEMVRVVFWGESDMAMRGCSAIAPASRTEKSRSPHILRRKRAGRQAIARS